MIESYLFGLTTILTCDASASARVMDPKPVSRADINDQIGYRYVPPLALLYAP